LVSGYHRPVHERALESENESRLHSPRSHVRDATPVEELLREITREGDGRTRVGQGERRVADRVETGLERDPVRVEVVRRKPVRGIHRPHPDEGNEAGALCMSNGPRTEREQEKQMSGATGCVHGPTSWVCDAALTPPPGTLSIEKWLLTYMVTYLARTMVCHLLRRPPGIGSRYDATRGLSRCRYCCTRAMAMLPSPTAAATRLIGLKRTSPHAKMP